MAKIVTTINLRTNHVELQDSLGVEWIPYTRLTSVGFTFPTEARPTGSTAFMFDDERVFQLNRELTPQEKGVLAQGLG